MQFRMPINFVEGDDWTGRRSFGWFADVEVPVLESSDAPVVATWRSQWAQPVPYRLREDDLWSPKPNKGGISLLKDIEDIQSRIDPDVASGDSMRTTALFTRHPFYVHEGHRGYAIELDPGIVDDPRFVAALKRVEGVASDSFIADGMVWERSHGPLLHARHPGDNARRTLEFYTSGHDRIEQYLVKDHLERTFSAFDADAVAAEFRSRFRIKREAIGCSIAEGVWPIRSVRDRIAVPVLSSICTRMLDEFADATLNGCDKSTLDAIAAGRRAVSNGDAQELLCATETLLQVLPDGTDAILLQSWGATLTVSRSQHPAAQAVEELSDFSLR